MALRTTTKVSRTSKYRRTTEGYGDYSYSQLDDERREKCSIM